MESDTDRDKICCIILNYNDAKTAMGLAEELKGSRLIDDILLVDNCSTDDSWEAAIRLESITPWSIWSLIISSSQTRISM